MTFLIISFLAGVLTVLAPCSLPLLPVVIGTSASTKNKFTPYVVVASLGISVILFTYLIKASTLLIDIPQDFWEYLSGGILILFGLTLLFPLLWEKIPLVSKISIVSNKTLGEGFQKKSFWGDVVVGASLGPVFSTCSPTYFVILASVLPASFFLGSIYLLVYVLGLISLLLPIALIGERFISKIAGLSNPNGVFKKVIGFIFILLGVAIALGFEKKFQTVILDNGYFDVTTIEQSLLEKVKN